MFLYFLPLTYMSQQIREKIKQYNVISMMQHIDQT